MGRPLNKKYFGNRNTGSTITAADDGIGGKGVASVPVTTAGSYTTTRPTIAFNGAPDLLSGQAPTATITSEALSAAVSGTQTGTYVVGDLITVTSTGGTATAYVQTVVAGAVTVVNFTGTGSSRGSFQALTATTTTGGSGSGLVLTLTYRAKEVLITDSGSGYTTTVPTTTLTNAGGLVVGTVVMTTPVANTAPAGSGFNPEAAIIAQAYTGSSVKQADIVKQVAKDRYKINTSDTAGTPIIATLKSSIATQVGDMTINATDSAGGTYWVTKLTAHKATLVPNTGTLFPLVNGLPQQAPWSFSTATNGYVQIDNG